MRRRSRVNLLGSRSFRPINLDGRTMMNIGERNIDYLDFKMSVITNFLEPLVNADTDTILKNQYNFDYILSRLNDYKNNSNMEEITMMKKVVDLMKNASEVRISYSDMYERLYGSGGVGINRMIFETSRIILKAPFEIYDNIFGVREKQTYNMEIIREIENILESHPGIMFDDIKRKIDLLNFVLDE